MGPVRCWQPKFPEDNRDLWEFFWAALEGCVSAEFVWTKAHRSFGGLTGLDLAIARANDAADAQVKACVKKNQASSALYRKVVQAKLASAQGEEFVGCFPCPLGSCCGWSR